MIDTDEIIGSVAFAGNVIVEWTDHVVTLNSHGNKHEDVKDAMNHASAINGLGFIVVQRTWGWHALLPNGNVRQYRGSVMRFHR